MPVSIVMRRALLGAVALVCAAVLALAIVIVGADAGYFRTTLVAYVERSTLRTITVAGPFSVHLLSLHPSLSARDVTIGNPPWTPAGVTAHIDVLEVVFELPLIGHSRRIDRVRIQGANLTLYRDFAGRANWQRRDPALGTTEGSALLGGLSAINVHVRLNDERRHLNFDGTVSAQDAKRADGASALQMKADGQLNGKAVALELTGDSLQRASQGHPYRFTLSEKSSGSLLIAQGSLPRPFDFSFLDASFEASGADLKDLYFLTGVSLINTGTYRLTGSYSRSGARTHLTALQLKTGTSDVEGTVEVETVHDRSRSNATLHAQRVHAADFGLRAAGRSTAPYTLLFSDAAINPDALRRGDADVAFDARLVDVGRQVLQDVSGTLAIEKGVLTAAPLAAGWLGGKLRGRIELDANQNTPLAEVEFTLEGAQLAQLPHKSAEPPLEGALRAQLKISGRGFSAHQVAASADGVATMTMPQGTVRASLAELAGLDLRGLGLALENSHRDTQVRCAKAAFQAHAGVLTAQQLMMDTVPVRIDGEGSIHMDTESLNLVLHGEPKSLRVLRLKAPLLIRGTLVHPSFSIAASDSKLLLVDRGHAKNEDCAALAP